jgi:nucleotidyltransferase/DNA polymerase involved in DNA repair
LNADGSLAASDIAHNVHKYDLPFLIALFYVFGKEKSYQIAQGIGEYQVLNFSPLDLSFYLKIPL